VTWEPKLDDWVQVVLPAATCIRQRGWLYCEERPEPCSIHQRHHGGDLYIRGHRDEERHLVGQIVSQMGGVNEAHPWIVRYTANLVLGWPNGRTVVVNGGLYATDELVPLAIDRP